MKSLFTSVMLAGILSMSTAAGQVPEGPEFDLLRALVGDYTYHYTEMGQESDGHITFRPFDGGRFVLFDENYSQPDGPDGKIHGVVGYDDATGLYTWYRVFSSGAWDYASGKGDGDSIVFDMIALRWEPIGGEDLQVPGARFRTIWSGVGTDDWVFRWERSVDGGPWEQTGEGRSKPMR